MIAPERLEQVAMIVETAGLSDQTVGALRESFRDMHLTYCMDDDIGVGEPIRREKGFNLYLVDGRSHCVHFTTDLEAATGIVLAEVECELKLRPQHRTHPPGILVKSPWKCASRAPVTGNQTR